MGDRTYIEVMVQIQDQDRVIDYMGEPDDYPECNIDEDRLWIGAYTEVNYGGQHLHDDILQGIPHYLSWGDGDEYNSGACIEYNGCHVEIETDNFNKPIIPMDGDNPDLNHIGDVRMFNELKRQFLSSE